MYTFTYPDSISTAVMYSERLEFITLHIYLCLALIRNFPYYYVRKKPLKALLYRDDIFIAKRPPLLADSWQLALYEKLLSTFFISRPSPRKSQGCSHFRTTSNSYYEKLSAGFRPAPKLTVPMSSKPHFLNPCKYQFTKCAPC